MPCDQTATRGAMNGAGDALRPLLTGVTEMTGGIATASPSSSDLSQIGIGRVWDRIYRRAFGVQRRKEDTMLGRETPVVESVNSTTAIGNKAPVLLHTASSQMASATSTCVFYPFDVLKTRFVSQDGTRQRQHNGQNYRSVLGPLRIIYREEGLRTLFCGCHVAVCGAATAWGLYMFLYRSLCNITGYVSLLDRSAVSILASMIATFVASPIFMIKARMQLEEATKSANYRTFRGGVRYTVESTGIRSLWRGASLQLVLVFPNALGIPMYDFLKNLRLQYRECHMLDGPGSVRGLDTIEVCACSTTAKIFIMVVSHPMTVLKIRLQDPRSVEGSVQYRRICQSLAVILKTQGVRGLYRGYTVSLAHSLPRSLLHYFLYENTLNFLCSRYQ